MQLMILGDESPRLLRLASQFLLDVAQVHEAELKNGAPLMPAEPAETVDLIDPTPVKLDAEPREVFAVPAPPPPPAVLDAAADVVVATVPTPAQLDKRGFPHDARIHSKEPKLNADGTWRARRGLDNAELERVEAELRAAGYGAPSVTVNVGPGVASVQVPLPPPIGAVAGTDAPAAVTAPTVTPTVMVPPPPPVAPVVPSGPAPGASAFQILMQRVSRNAQGLCAPAAIAPTWAKVGVKGWADFFQRPDLIPAMTAELDAMGAV